MENKANLSNQSMDDKPHRKKPDTLVKTIVKKFLRNKLAVVGAVLLIIISGVAIIAPLIVPYDPLYQNVSNKLAEPSKDAWMGTDHFGRDIFNRVLYGARVSLSVGFLAMLFSLVIGVLVGAIAGFYGGWIDALLMRLVDVLISFPNIFLLIALIGIFSPGIEMLILILGSLGWMGVARLVRGEFLSLRTRNYVLAAKTIGMKNSAIIFKHILPNAIGPIIVVATLSVGNIIIAESTFSFLGLGVQPPTASWGNMLQAAQDYTVMRTAWWYPMFPGIMILVTVLSLNFVGDGLRDAFDPNMD